MKRFSYIAAAMMAFAACTGYVDPEQDGTDDPAVVPDEITGPFTLSVDKTEVEADGQDCVTFSLKDAYDREMLGDKKTLQGVNIVSDKGMRVERMTTEARFIANGDYNFTATYNGQKSNAVKVTARNRGTYEKYHKNVAIYKATATWCGPCAVMTRAIEGMNEDTKAHSVELCWHGQDELAVTPAGAEMDYGSFLISYFEGLGFPTVILDLKEKTIENASSGLDKAIWKLRAQYPATSGLKLATEYDEADKVIKASAELLSSTGGKYDIGMALLLNNQVIPGGTNDGGKYSHIVRAATGNFYMYSSDGLTELPKDGKKTFSVEIPVGNHKLADLSVAAFAIVPDADAARIDNIVEVKAGESVDYMLND